MQRDQQALALGCLQLLLIKVAQCAGAHEAGAYEFGSLHLDGFFEHGDLTVSRNVFDAQRASSGHDGRLFIAVEIVATHVCDAGARLGAPSAHRMRMLARVLLDGIGDATVRVAFAQYRVDGTAQYLCIAGATGALGVSLRCIGIVGHGIALRLQFAYG